MSDSLIVSLLLNISLLLLAATLLMEIRPLRSILYFHDAGLPQRLLIAVLFGMMAILSTYCGINAYDAIINTRVISVTAAGLLGGPVAGIGAGLIGGIHRYFYAPESFTALGCCVGTITFGVIGAAGGKFFRHMIFSRLFQVGITIAGELCQVVWLFLLARPIGAVIVLEQHILIPKIIVNSLGMVLLFSTFNRFRQSRADELIDGQSRTLYIADQCLPYLRRGLRPGEDVQKVADIIRTHAALYRVMLCDRERLVALSGFAAAPAALPEYMAASITSGETQVRTDRRARRWGERQEEAIAVPLRCGGEVVGAMALQLDQTGLQLAGADIRFAESLASFLSTLLQRNELDREIARRRKAEFRAFQSQINPHFFFNALNTISALCRTDPDEARSLLLVLADYYRQILSINEEFVTLTTELHNVDNYLTIAKARFVDAIHFTAQVPDNTDECRLPPLIIQPLVENAVRHGGVAVDDRRVALSARREGGRIHIAVSDQGRGFPPEILKEINDPNNKRYSGLFNVCKRLVSVYGPESRLQIESGPKGSTVRFSIPVTPAVSSEKEADL